MNDSSMDNSNMNDSNKNNVNKLPIILASRSPRRQELLTQIGVQFEVLDNEIDESALANEKPLAYVERMAKEKAVSAWSGSAIKALNHFNDRALLAADTSVVLGDTILGKPDNIQHAREILSQLSDNTHQVITSVALINKQALTFQTSITQVTFAKLSRQVIEEYCQMGEGMDKAGSYAIQGVAAKFVRSIEGSYSGVVGLPLYETSLLLEAHFNASSQAESSVI